MKNIFIIGAPRSGTTMLERVLSAHSLIKGGSEPHLLTPLAHLGVWNNVDKAPYDHIVASIGQRDFVEHLPNGTEDYWKACRAYCDSLYRAYMANSDAAFCLDKTPEYATVLPFLTKVYPDAAYIVLTRHPAAIFSSLANSFFDGDYQITQEHERPFERYLPTMACFMRSDAADYVHVAYEELVSEPDKAIEKICKYLDISFEPECINYGGKALSSGLGDPLNISRHKKPSTDYLDKWVEEFVASEEKFHFVKGLLDRIADDDLELLGYDRDTLWLPYAKAAKTVNDDWRRPKLNRYRLERKVIVRGRDFVQHHGWARKLLDKLRLVCEVLLREY